MIMTIPVASEYESTRLVAISGKLREICFRVQGKNAQQWGMKQRGTLVEVSEHTDPPTTSSLQFQ
jgi:hypothetical protein